MNPRLSALLGLGFLGAVVSAFSAQPVRVWETNLVIPTYLAAPPSPVPRFYEGRTYQGAKATFYPYPVQDVLTETRTNQTYKALFLENEYLELSVIPELGGRIWSARDKSNGYDFFYRQHVVKPALIGMLGAWISGGVEWNVPHHHRASSFSPVDFTTTTNADGSATIWVGEIELRHRMKWLVGMTLHPDRSDLELTCKMFNRTPFAHPMLFWINTAVHANEHYQVIFPPSTEWATQHSKPEFAGWPIARQTYGGTDYTRGVDISWWKNHPNPVSFFAWNDQDDWFGGYDHGRQAGVIHVADRHVVPGKKFFEWGNGPEGETWSKILTDDDGPYLELMAGAWSDNQPDYSWIQPGETREWQHWWYPVRNLGGVKAANRDLAINWETTNGLARIAVNATRLLTNVTVELRWEDKALWGVETNLSPARPFVGEAPLIFDFTDTQLARLNVVVKSGRTIFLIASNRPPEHSTPMPKPAERPKAPKDYASTDELYFTGQRVEQLYSPSFEAAPYYEEMLRRDPGDYRANTALGIMLCKQWRWDDAAAHLSNALARATAQYIRPKDGEAFYYLGVARRGQAIEVGRNRLETRASYEATLDAAADSFLKAAWSEAWKGPGFHQVAEIEALRGNHLEALVAIEQSLARGGRNPKALNLQSAILRRLGRVDEAVRSVSQSLAIDPLDSWARVESWLAIESESSPSVGPNRDPRNLAPTIRKLPIPEVLEVVVDYSNAGFLREAALITQAAGIDYDGYRPLKTMHPLYHFWARHVDPVYAFEQGTREMGRAGQGPIGLKVDLLGLFPFQYESVEVLGEGAISNRSETASYLLGNLVYDHQPGRAIQAWEAARDRLAANPGSELANRTALESLVHRNLALAYAQHEKDLPKAIASLERAVELDPTEPRFLYELDVQYEAGGAPLARRLESLTRHHDVVARRDDALTREIVLLTAAGRAERALELLRGRRFRNWEGSSQIHGVYVDACLAQGQRLLRAGMHREALREYEAALEYPDNLEVGRARRSPRNAQIQYLIGTAHEALGDPSRAKAAFERAAEGRGRGASESQYYHGLALRKLGRTDEAGPVFEQLVKEGEERLQREAAPDYFAKFGGRDSERGRKAEAYFLQGLGRLGQGRPADARAAFAQALAQDPGHVGANLHHVGSDLYY